MNKPNHQHLDSSGVFNCLFGSACTLPHAGEQFDAMLEALNGVLHHNDGLKDDYKLSPALIRHVKAAIAKGTGK